MITFTSCFKKYDLFLTSLGQSISSLLNKE